MFYVFSPPALRQKRFIFSIYSVERGPFVLLPVFLLAFWVDRMIQAHTRMVYLVCVLGKGFAELIVNIHGQGEQFL